MALIVVAIVVCSIGAVSDMILLVEAGGDDRAIRTLGWVILIALSFAIVTLSLALGLA